MGCFQVRYDSRVVIYERKLFIRLATVVDLLKRLTIVIYVSRVVNISNLLVSTTGRRGSHQSGLSPKSK